MTVKEGLQKIKELFNDMPAPVVPAPVEAAAAADYTLADGTVVSIDKLEVGGLVAMAGAPVADAEYTLADGTCFTTVAGVISEVATKEEEATEPVTELQAPASAPAPVPNKALMSLVEKLEEKIETQGAIIKEMFALVETMGAQEIAAPLEEPAKAWNDMSALEKFRANK